MEQNCSHHISDECVIYIRDKIENLIEEITKEATIEFNELNDNREKQNLRRLKRLNSWSINKASEKILKNLNHPNMGSQPAMIGSLGDIMYPDNDVTKSAKTIGNFKEVVQ